MLSLLSTIAGLNAVPVTVINTKRMNFHGISYLKNFKLLGIDRKKDMV